ncbi:hypothetical protein AKJ09_08694 [Labilithrix luteola]|uniref:Uncharacterized protein n=1 Tax=Labilithrix luteola TaxID=1391654 RepID=A0A0K1Q893_9BACT|nr:hypothetical protein AKJ09_08694 [Labilithrix luteola]
MVHHQHRPFELGGRLAFEREPTLGAGRCGLRVLSSTVRTEHENLRDRRSDAERAERAGGRNAKRNEQTRGSGERRCVPRISKRRHRLPTRGPEHSGTARRSERRTMGALPLFGPVPACVPSIDEVTQP